MSQNPINDGGPAFPDPARADGRFGDAGMTLRDYFAAKAMQGLVSQARSNPCGDHFAFADGELLMQYQNAPDHVARMSYEIADAMLRAREVQP